jgi:hypothetical protein
MGSRPKEGGAIHNRPEKCPLALVTKDSRVLRAFVATLRDQGSANPQFRGRGFYCPAQPPSLREEPLTLRSRQARQRRVPQLRRFHTHNPSGVIEPCYVVLPLPRYFPTSDSLLTSMLHFCGTSCCSASHCCASCISLLCCCASCVLLLTSHCPCFTGPISLPTRGEVDMAYNKIYERGGRSSLRSLR